tara:strand:+ start:24 stop:260 length:237 start_codon:yes stop_codon:yes gene_type:complete
MANKKNYTLKIAGPDDPIYKQGFQIYSVSSKQDYIQQRKKKEGLENQFLHTINPRQSHEKILENLIKALQDNGWKLKR